MQKIALSLGFSDLSQKNIKQIKEQTTLDKMREKLKKGNISYYPTNREDNWKLFREGTLGGWKKYLKPYHMKDISRIEKGKFSIFSKLVYTVIFSLRRIIFRIE